MPALAEVTFAATDTDATPPVYNGGGVWTLYSPLSPEASSAQLSSGIALHYDINVPLGHTYYILPYGNDDAPGAASVFVMPGTWLGTGTLEPLSLTTPNFASGGTVTAEQPIAYLLVVPPFDHNLINS